MEPNTWKLTLGQNQEILMNVTISNQREPAYETQLFIIHPTTLSYIGRKIEVRVRIKIICDSGGPIPVWGVVVEG